MKEYFSPYRCLKSVHTHACACMHVHVWCDSRAERVQMDGSLDEVQVLMVGGPCTPGTVLNK